MNLEQQIVNQLFHNDRYSSAIFPHLKAEYFADTGNRLVFEAFGKFVTKYNTIPTPVAIGIELEQTNMQEHQYEAAKTALAINTKSSPVDYDWIVDQTEKYVKDRAMENAIREGISILGDEKRSTGEIEDLVRNALSISFDSNLGLDVFADAERQYDLTHAEKRKIPFMIEIFNRATNGGVEEKTLNVIQAGCVHPETQVTIKYDYECVTRIVKVPISCVQSLVEEGEILVDSPAGFVPVVEFVDKGMHEEYVLRLENGTQVRSNGDHLYMTNLYGWLSAREIAVLTSNTQTLNIMTDKGLVAGSVVITGRMIPIVDIVVDHPDHAYYTNGVVSHNTNVGKSLLLCHLAADYLMQGLDILYVTYEMAEEKIAARVYANILNIDLDKHEHMPREWFLNKISETQKRTPGRLMVKEYPSGGAHAGHIRHHIQELKLKKKFVPKIIIFDYLGIAASSRYRPGSVARHVYLQAIAQEFRGLCQELKATGWTGVQANRAGFTSSAQSMSDIAESWGIPHEADWYLVVSQPADLEELGQFLCLQEKSRYSDKGKLKKFTIGVDKGKQRVFDVDQNQQAVMVEQVVEHEESVEDVFRQFSG